MLLPPLTKLEFRTLSDRNEQLIFQARKNKKVQKAHIQDNHGTPSSFFNRIVYIPGRGARATANLGGSNSLK